MEYIKDAVTFIIPTLGRYSLHTTLQSLREQTNPNWKSIIVFDRHDITIPNEDKFEIYKLEREGGMSAGTVRNFALDKVNTEWVAFVDDDDWLSPNYTQRIFDWGKKFDLIVFTYRDVENGNTQPPHNLNRLVRCNVGISFAIRTSIVKDNNIKFIPGGVEDFQFIEDCVNAGANWVITHEVLYFVGHRSAWGDR